MTTQPASSTKTLTLGEVSAFLGWTPRFVERLAVGGQLPGRKTGGWEFRRDELVDWLDRKLQTLDAARVADLEHQLERDLAPDEAPVTGLTARLTPAGINLALLPGRKAAVLDDLLALAARTGLVRGAPQLRATVLEREALCSTALPGGVALVHPRHPLPAALGAPLLVIGRTLAPVDFGAADGEPTQLFFLVADLDERAHLHTLARLVRLLRGPTLAALLAARTPEEVVTTFARAEAALNA